jgi:hypothetical protein
MKKTKNYTIRYVYAGIYQYADFREEDGKITRKSFNPNWVSNGVVVPTFEGIDTIDGILKEIKTFAGRQAEIHLIDQMLPKYYRSKVIRSQVTKSTNLIQTLIADECFKFFNDCIKPIMLKKKYFVARSHMMRIVLIEKRNGEWENIIESKESRLIEFSCYQLLKSIGLYDGDVDLKSEHNSFIISGFANLWYQFTVEQVKIIDLYIEL